MTDAPIPPRARRIRTGERSERVAIRVRGDQRAEAERLATVRGLTVSSYLYELLATALVNDAAAVAEEEGTGTAPRRRAQRRPT